jgi:glutamyl-tRNA reductase
VSNRSADRARAVAARHGAALVPWNSMGAACAAADVIVACTAAPRAVVTAAMLAGAPPRARVFVDLGVPRNVHEDVRALPDTRVLDVDALRFWSGAGEGVDARAAEHGRAAAEREVERWVARFATWQRARAHVPTIRRLRAEAERVRDAETDRALARLGSLSPREEAIVRAMSARLVNKLLHHPLVALATAPESAEWVDAARRLLGHADVRADAHGCPVMGAVADADAAVRPLVPHARSA